MPTHHSASKHLWTIIASFALPSLLIAGSASAQTYDMKDFYPLENGREYSYVFDPIQMTVQGSLLTANGTQSIKITAGNTQHGESTMRLTQAVTLKGYSKPVGSFSQSGNQVDYMNWTDLGVNIHRREFTSNGTLDNSSTSITFAGPLFAFPRSLNLGETVSVSDYSLDTHSITSEEVTLSEITTISTDLGEFECLKIRWSGDSGSETWYLARGVGLVMLAISTESVFGVEGNDLIIRLKQTNFTITHLPVDVVTYPETRQNSWLLEYYAYGAGWAWNWHPTLGWFYGDPADSGCWLFFPDQGWLYSTAEWFPFAFAASSERWTWVDIASGTVYPL